MTEYCRDVGGAAFEEEESGYDGFLFFDHFTACAAHDFFAGVEEVVAMYVVFYGVEGLFDLFEADSRTELHGVPVGGVGGQCGDKSLLYGCGFFGGDCVGLEQSENGVEGWCVAFCHAEEGARRDAVVHRGEAPEVGGGGFFGLGGGQSIWGEGDVE